MKPGQPLSSGLPPWRSVTATFPCTAAKSSGLHPLVVGCSAAGTGSHSAPPPSLAQRGAQNSRRGLSVDMNPTELELLRLMWRKTGLAEVITRVI